MTVRFFFVDVSVMKRPAPILVSFRSSAELVERRGCLIKSYMCTNVPFCNLSTTSCVNNLYSDNGSLCVNLTVGGDVEREGERRAATATMMRMRTRTRARTRM